jgi:hypothetical protein
MNGFLVLVNFSSCNLPVFLYENENDAIALAKEIADASRARWPAVCLVKKDSLSLMCVDVVEFKEGSVVTIQRFSPSKVKRDA